MAVTRCQVLPVYKCYKKADFIKYYYNDTMEEHRNSTRSKIVMTVVLDSFPIV